MAVIRPDSLPEEWHCPYCNYGEYRNRADWERRAADHIDQCDKRPMATSSIPHDRHRDDSETEIEGVRSVCDNIFDDFHGRLGPCLLVVSGPDGDDEIRLSAASECYLTREAAAKLRDELTRRLEGK